MRTSDRLARATRRRRTQAAAWDTMQDAASQGFLPAACVVEPDENKRKVVLAAMCDYLCAQGADVILADQDPDDTPHWDTPLPAVEAAEEALGTDGTPERPVILVVPRLDHATPEINQYLRTARARGHCYFLSGVDPIAAPNRDDYRTISPDDFAVGIDGDWNLIEGAFRG